jgi:hypothetical protein
MLKEDMSAFWPGLVEMMEQMQILSQAMAAHCQL